jgi:hypothetical protein
MPRIAEADSYLLSLEAERGAQKPIEQRLYLVPFMSSEDERCECHLSAKIRFLYEGS